MDQDREHGKADLSPITYELCKLDNLPYTSEPFSFLM